MKSDASSADAVYVRGLCLYYKDNLDKGLTHFQQVLTLDPDHSKAKVMRIKAKSLKEKKENGKKFLKRRKYQMLIKFIFMQATNYTKWENSAKLTNFTQKHLKLIH